MWFNGWFVVSLQRCEGREDDAKIMPNRMSAGCYVHRNEGLHLALGGNLAHIVVEHC